MNTNTAPIDHVTKTGTITLNREEAVLVARAMDLLASRLSDRRDQMLETHPERVEDAQRLLLDSEVCDKLCHAAKMICFDLSV